MKIGIYDKFKFKHFLCVDFIATCLLEDKTMNFLIILFNSVEGLNNFLLVLL